MRQCLGWWSGLLIAFHVVTNQQGGGHRAEHAVRPYEPGCLNCDDLGDSWELSLLNGNHPEKRRSGRMMQSWDICGMTSGTQRRSATILPGGELSPAANRDPLNRQL